MVNMDEKETKVKKKIRLRGFLVIILFLYLLFSVSYYFYKEPVKSINIKNNYYLTDDYIIELLDLNNKTIFEVNSRKLEKLLNKEDLVSSAEIKKSILGNITIDVKENKILFYNWNTASIVLEDGEEVAKKDTYLGVPSLINYVPSDIYQKFIKKFASIDREIIEMVSEIEYSADVVGNVTIDENRFLLRMNDGNSVYVNIYNLTKLNNYLEIYDALLKNNSIKNGCLYLDSNSKNYVYSDCKEEVVVPNEE